MNKTFTILAVIVVLIGGYIIVTNNITDSDSVDVSEDTNDNVSVTADNEEQTDIREIEVSGSEFNFSPSLIEVNPGEEVKIIFTNEGDARHDFVIPEIGSTEIIEAGDTDTFVFTAPETLGDYPITYYCSVPGHKEQGMEGTLRVAN